MYSGAQEATGERFVLGKDLAQSEIHFLKIIATLLVAGILIGLIKISYLKFLCSMVFMYCR